MYYVGLFIFVISGFTLLFGFFAPDKVTWGKRKTRMKVITTYFPIMIVGLLASLAFSGEGLSSNIAQIESEINKVEKAQQQEKDSVEASNTENSNNNELPIMQVDFIDVGQGDAALLQYEHQDEDFNVLIDSGDWQGNEAVEHLEKENIEDIDLMALSHEHADHIGQADDIIDNFNVQEVWLPGNEADTQVYESVLDSIEENNVDYNEPRAGEEYQIGSLSVDVVSPQELTDDLNDDSIVMHLTYGDVKFMFSGDAETNAEQLMVKSDYDLSADILKAGHHGSNTSSITDYIEEVDPNISIVSVGEVNQYHHPHDDVIRRLNKYSDDVYLTKDDGTITIETNGIDYEVK